MALYGLSTVGSPEIVEVVITLQPEHLICQLNLHEQMHELAVDRIRQKSFSWFLNRSLCLVVGKISDCQLSR